MGGRRGSPWSGTASPSRIDRVLLSSLRYHPLLRLTYRQHSLLLPRCRHRPAVDPVIRFLSLFLYLSFRNLVFSIFRTPAILGQAFRRSWFFLGGSCWWKWEQCMRGGMFEIDTSKIGLGNFFWMRWMRGLCSKGWMVMVGCSFV